MLPLQLLEVVNHGWQCNNGQVYLRKAAHRNRTVQELMDDQMKFALPNLTIQRDVFVIYMSKFSLTFCFDSFVNNVVQLADVTHSYTRPQSPLIVTIHMDSFLFFSSHTYSTMTCTPHTCDSFFSHLLHHDSYSPHLWLVLLTLTPLWLVLPTPVTHSSHTYSTMTHQPILYFYYIYS